MNSIDILKNINKFQESVKNADEVVISIICCDSRVVLPFNTVRIKDSSYPSAYKNVIFISLPTIGSGTPSKSRIRRIKKTLLDWGVKKERIKIMVTQHGDSQEIYESQCIREGKMSKHITCGLRGFFLTHSAKLKQIHELLRRFTEKQKRHLDDRTYAPDRQTLEKLNESCPSIMKIVDEIHIPSGESGHRVPRRLIIRAAYRNFSYTLEDNTNSVAAKITEYLKDEEHKDIYQTCEVYEAYYDHNEKKLTFSEYAFIGDEKIVDFSNVIPKRLENYQDPEHIVISYGKEAPVFPACLLAQEICHLPDNAFRTVASVAKPSHLLCAFSEASYAVLHHNKPHTGDYNFRKLSSLIIICDSKEYVDAIKDTLESGEWKEEFSAHYQKFTDHIDIINLNIDDNSNKIDYLKIMV